MDLDLIVIGTIFLVGLWAVYSTKLKGQLPQFSHLWI